MRFTCDQVRRARYHLQEAANSALLASWRSEDRVTAYDYHVSELLFELDRAAFALGYSFEPLPVTDKPGFDGRDDRSIGIKEADVT